MSVSFSERVKAELERAPLGKHCCKTAELSAILYSTAKLFVSENNEFMLTVENRRAYAVKRARALAAELFGIQGDDKAGAGRGQKAPPLFGGVGGGAPVPEDKFETRANWRDKDALRILSACGLLSDPGCGAEPRIKEWFALTDVERPAVSHRSCCSRAFLRGSFLGAGSVSDPGKEYHLELATGDDTLRELWLDLFNRFRLSARLAPRKGVSVVYLKEAERISRALTLMGAGAARCEYENARIIKDMRNQANRAANCDNANTDKAIDAAQRQIEAIELLKRTVGLSTLPDPLFDAAKKRLEHPELSLADLGRSLQPPVGKSGANHRLKRIEEIARHGDISREAGINDDTTE